MKRIVVIITAVILALSLVAGFAYGVSQTTVRSITMPVVPTELTAGPGREKVKTLCAICHSVDYITMQPKLTRAQWTATTNKMIKVMGAPIGEDDAKEIINYLVANYGTGN
ncbi:MAG TPA: hypothetical protein VFG09_06885 [Thermodesulfovibrionales bacterium]|nr:hypothetical protein [Thermodesulfovibrionales bacterium]